MAGMPLVAMVMSWHYRYPFYRCWPCCAMVRSLDSRFASLYRPVVRVPVKQNDLVAFARDHGCRLRNLLLKLYLILS